MITWKELAAEFPEFVQWVVQKYGPLPEGPVSEEEIIRYTEEFRATLEAHLPHA